MTNKHKIINDPVFGFLTIENDLIYDVLQHPYVQRLTRIRQLGLSHFVYPGATHTRFLHSIGAMHLMQNGLNSLATKGISISDNERTAAQLAILLHDIGHGPFSHVLEHTLVDGITHEEISQIMMEVIRCTMHDARCTVMEMAIAIFQNKYPRHFLHQLISSQLDVDRMDYLCRDSFFTGVQEGRVASERLLKMLHVVDDRLVVEHKGIYSVEKFLVARRLMYWQVYLHKTSVAAEQMLQKILQRAKQLAAQGIELFAAPSLHYFLYNHISADDFYPGSEALRHYTMLDDSDLLSAVKEWMTCDDRVLSLLSKAFTHRLLFQSRLLTEPLNMEQREELRTYYAQQLNIDRQDADYFFVEHISTGNTYSEKDDSIDILYNDGIVKDIAAASEILDLHALTYKPQKLYLFQFRT